MHHRKIGYTKTAGILLLLLATARSVHGNTFCGGGAVREDMLVAGGGGWVGFRLVRTGCGGGFFMLCFLILSDVNRMQHIDDVKIFRWVPGYSEVKDIAPHVNGDIAIFGGGFRCYSREEIRIGGRRRGVK